MCLNCIQWGKYCGDDTIIASNGFYPTHDDTVAGNAVLVAVNTLFDEIFFFSLFSMHEMLVKRHALASWIPDLKRYQSTDDQGKSTSNQTPFQWLE